VHALATYAGLRMTAVEMAELACSLEIERLNMPIGKQDQYASTVGGLNTIAFAADGVSVSPLTLPADVVSSLSARLMLFSTGQNRDSAAILGQQRADTEKKPATMEALHHIKALAVKMQEALLAGDLALFGQLLDLGWHQKKRLSRKVTSSAIDHWYATARRAGAIGGKIAGAGGGGFLLLYCPQRRQQAVRKALAACGLHEMTFDIDFGGTQILSNFTDLSGPGNTLPIPLFND
ncbi:MAG: GHMP kinase, partial [Chloroflexi bacterium]|nr:GHMP kinase [Chloroflexota bacterium]